MMQVSCKKAKTDQNKQYAQGWLTSDHDKSRKQCKGSLRYLARNGDAFYIMSCKIQLVACGVVTDLLTLLCCGSFTHVSCFDTYGC